MDISSLRKKTEAGFLDGQMLIAMPGMPDSRFARTVIYMCAHSSEGAMGIVVNKLSRSISFPDLLQQLDIIDKDEAIRLPRRVGRVPVLAGGPVETTRGFVLHSMDMTIEDSTLPISENIGLTITLDMLRAIARGEGPEEAVLALGYASWGAGQLEREIQENTWLHGPVTQALIFSPDHDAKYDIALRQLGIDPAFLSQEAGHA
ncbi:MAG TPA: YqgE/AlgH family protein [Rhabdaerophilum sp.]|nr:YqgE/AlgH family protein [Rhabdaerophilum sp.]